MSTVPSVTFENVAALRRQDVIRTVRLIERGHFARQGVELLENVDGNGMTCPSHSNGAHGMLTASCHLPTALTEFSEWSEG
jgi:hypothetical protein